MLSAASFLNGFKSGLARNGRNAASCVRDRLWGVALGDGARWRWPCAAPLQRRLWDQRDLRREATGREARIASRRGRDGSAPRTPTARPAAALAMRRAVST